MFLNDAHSKEVSFLQTLSLISVFIGSVHNRQSRAFLLALYIFKSEISNFGYFKQNTIVFSKWGLCKSKFFHLKLFLLQYKYRFHILWKRFSHVISPDKCSIIYEIFFSFRKPWHLVINLIRNAHDIRISLSIEISIFCFNYSNSFHCPCIAHTVKN